MMWLQLFHAPRTTMYVYVLLSCLALAAGKTDESFKDQFCTDPRTMEKHAAYSEWADAYSCSRHRCQPGGRNLAIYTVGCKRVEAPESAIECEEVVEDTNMQFPYCCTRLRCLVVVRGEVWTRVLGQPWETLPAAPWSHMYKMKKPPPGDETFAPKHADQGPVFELQTDATEEHEKTMRSSKSKVLKDPDCKDCHPTALTPDIVIALSTGNDDKDAKKTDSSRHKSIKLKAVDLPSDDSDREREIEVEESPVTEKAPETSDEKFYPNTLASTTKAPHKTQNSWSQIPQNQWGDQPSSDVESTPQVEEKPETTGLQALVDAIGNRMKDIEDVVQRMSAKVVHKSPEHEESEEKRKKHVAEDKSETNQKEKKKPKKQNNDSDYKRFTVKNRGSKYLRSSTDGTTEPPLYIEDTSLNGYFSDASNVLRRANQDKEPSLTYMAPVENHRKPHAPESAEVEKKHKKHSHKKRKGKGKGHKKRHGKEDTKKRYNKVASIELDKNYISFEDNSGIFNTN